MNMDVIVRLSRVDSCAVSDALDKLGLSGAVTGLHRLSTDRRIAGRVITVKLEQDDGRPTALRHLGTAAIDAAHPGDVIVCIEQQNRHRRAAAAWGGNLALGAKLQRVAGVIVDGPVRDVDECRQHDFTLFAPDCTGAHRARPDRRNRNQRADRGGRHPRRTR